MPIAAQTSSVQGRAWVVIVDLVISLLTVLGAGTILVNMFWREYRLGRAATVRMRIVQALVMSDFLLGVIAFIPSAEDLRGIQHQHGSSFCSGFGLLLVAVLWSEHLWTLTLAFTTYMILIYPLSAITRAIEKYWAGLWLIIWTIAFAVGVVGFELYGYFPSGGLCYYGNNSGLYGELIQFMPRATVLCCIVFFYARLYVFLKRPDRLKISYTSSGNRHHSGSNGLYSNSPVSSRGSTSSRLRSSRDRTGTSRERIKTSFNRFSFKPKGGQSGGPNSNAYPMAEYRQSGADSDAAEMTVEREVPPWERLDLPAFQIDGKRYGGSPPNLNRTQTPTRQSWSDWKAAPRNPIDGTTPTDPKLSIVNNGTRRSTLSSTPESNTTDSIDSNQITKSGLSPRHTTRLLSMAAATNSMLVSSSIDLDVLTRNTPRSIELLVDTVIPSSDVPNNHTSDTQLGLPPHTSTGLPSHSVSGSLTPSSSLYSQQPSSAQMLHKLSDDGTRRCSSTTAWDDHSRRGSGPVSFALPEVSKNQMNVLDAEKDASIPTDPTSDPESLQPAVAVAHDDGDDDDSDAEIDFARILRESDPNTSGQQNGRKGSEDTELVQESMTSYLNRKAAMLMLWFPLAYVGLFSVSLIRLIYDFSSKNDPVVLRAISRWLILAQGLVDAIIYGVVEWNVKRAVRKKVRKGLISPNGSGPGSWGSFRAGKDNPTARNQGGTSTPSAMQIDAKNR